MDEHWNVDMSVAMSVTQYRAYTHDIDPQKDLSILRLFVIMLCYLIMEEGSQMYIRNSLVIRITMRLLVFQVVLKYNVRMFHRDTHSVYA